MKNGTVVGRVSARPLFWASLTATTMLTGIGPALAQQAQDSSQIETVVVTAEKRSEDMQKVPISIEALQTEKLEQLHINDFSDYAKYFPSISYATGGAGGTLNGPGLLNINMRGITSGNDGNPSGPTPSVGVYLDEQPITTVAGTLNVHVYDIDRVEVLSGPQGTLYGASSEAGTIRIITNKPDASGFSAAFDVQGNTVSHGGQGYTAEGYVNVPLADNVAIRVVAWDEHDAGYINSVAGTRTYPGCDVTCAATNGVTEVPPFTINSIPKKNANFSDTYGARAELKIDLNDSWTITPALMAQWTDSHGLYGYDPSVGYLQVHNFGPEFVNQNWYQAALTVQGKIGDLDLTYSGGHMDWWIDSELNYSDYSYWYDKLFPSFFPQYFVDNGNNPIAPTQFILGKDHFEKDSHEIRIASPATDRLRFIAGLFYERQQHWILQNYQVSGLATSLSVDGWPQTWWLTDQERVDQDLAAYGDVSFDITPQLTLTGGLRLYDYLNRLKGFFGFQSHEAQCFAPGDIHNDPCTNLDARSVGTGNTHKINLSYKIDDAKMVYFTWSTGFRPGGVNRVSGFGTYSPDKLTNYEIGWKSTWLDDSVRFNGALFLEDWNNLQFPFLGPNSVTIIENAGNAVSKGFESDLEWKPISSLTISASGAVTDANLESNYCGFADGSGSAVTSCPGTFDVNPAEAPKGTQLPITPKYKGNLTARYYRPLTDSMTGFLQGSVQAQSSSWSDLRVQASFPPFASPGTLNPQVPIRQNQPGYASFDFSAGIDTEKWSVELFVENAFDQHSQLYRYAECTTQVCINQPYISPGRPRLIGIKVGTNF